MKPCPARILLPVDFALEQDHPPELLVEDFSSVRIAQQKWSNASITERVRLVKRLRHLIVNEATSLAETSARSRQRPRSETLAAEVLALIDACRFLERNAEAILTPARLGRWQRPVWLSGVRFEIHREPHGIVLIIGPGNYPLFLPGVQMLQALVAGNGVVLKPAPGGTGAASELIALIRQAGFPKDLIVLLNESISSVSSAIAARPDKVVFTGSAQAGRSVLSRLAAQIIPATLELSGSDSVIVRSDADLDLATRAILFGLRLNSGATCLAPRRVFVIDSVATDFEGRLTEALGEEQPSNWPSGQATTHHLTLIKEAIKAGAHVIAGSIDENHEAVLPIVLGGVPMAAPVLQADHFASVLTITTVCDDAEAIQGANNSSFGLGASIFTRNFKEGRAIARQLRAGLVTLNDIIIPSADGRIPFGGRGWSGFGATRGKEGLLDLTVPKVISVSTSKFRPALAPAGDLEEAIFKSYLNAFHGTGLNVRWKGLCSLVRHLIQSAKHYAHTQ